MLAPLQVAHNDTITAPAHGVSTAAHAFDAHDVLRVAFLTDFSIGLSRGGPLFRLRGVGQRESRRMTHSDQQLDLPMRGHPKSVDMADIARQKSWGAVLTYCASASGLQDKAIAAEIGMQDAVWSRCKTGTNSPSGEQLVRLDAPLRQFCAVVVAPDPDGPGPSQRSAAGVGDRAQGAWSLTEQLEAERTRSKILSEALTGRAVA